MKLLKLLAIAVLMFLAFTTYHVLHDPWGPEPDISTLSDAELLAECQKYPECRDMLKRKHI